MGEDADEEETVALGHNMLARKVLAGRHSLAPPRLQVQLAWGSYLQPSCVLWNTQWPLLLSALQFDNSKLLWHAVCSGFTAELRRIRNAGMC